MKQNRQADDVGSSMPLYVPPMRTDEPLANLPGSPNDFDIEPYQLYTFDNVIHQELAGRLLIAWQRAGMWTYVRGDDFIASINREAEKRQGGRIIQRDRTDSVLSLERRDYPTYPKAKSALFAGLQQMKNLNLVSLEGPKGPGGIGIILKHALIAPLPEFIRRLEKQQENPRRTTPGDPIDAHDVHQMLNR